MSQFRFGGIALKRFIARGGLAFQPRRIGDNMRLIIVSNRLPVTINRRGGKLNLQQSAGGLVSGISAYLDLDRASTQQKIEHYWVGWPGMTVEENDRKDLARHLEAEFKYIPVFLSNEEMDLFYHGFCNKTIWPLFHYFPSFTAYDEDYWQGYKKVNEIFCESLLKIVRPNDLVWIHDYHLMLLPQMLRKKSNSAAIGFFLHIPFPSFEIYRTLPNIWRREIIEGLLGADLIGFHTHEYTQNFLRTVLRLLGIEHNIGQMFVGNRMVRAATFPMGIEYKKYSEAVSHSRAQEEKRELRQRFANQRIILSIDRLDYTKGILNRLLGYEEFLTRNPQWHKQVVLAMVVVPSRIGVEHYQKMKRQIDELIGKINGRFGSFEWTPILYQYRFLSLDSLAALYSESDVALITPLRDGMNLIAKEYIAARTDRTGVLILSEMAGAAKELGEAVIINPYNTAEIAQALKSALEIPPEEQERRIGLMQQRLQRYDVVRWADEFIQEVVSVRDSQAQFEARLLRRHIGSKLVEEFRRASSKIIFLDYDGTLVPFASDPARVKPDTALERMLDSLCRQPGTVVALISGRDRETMEQWFGKFSMILVAEHGAWIKEPGKEWLKIRPLAEDWISHIQPILEIYSDRVPGSFVERKEFSVAWHYRNADPEQASMSAKELLDDLVHLTANIDVQVIPGNRVIEVRNAGINKGVAAKDILSRRTYDFIIAVGDDWTDEDLFRVLPESAYSIRVGVTQSYARYNLYNYLEVRDLIEEMIR